jgi:predicted component of type VI protein secretion system
MLKLLIVQDGPAAEGVVPEAVLPQPLARFTLGRDPSNHWVLPDPTRAVSGRHCEVVASPQGAVLRDLSTNGTFVNGSLLRMVGEHLLRDGDVLVLGPYAVRVQCLPEAGVAPAPGALAAAHHALPPPPLWHDTRPHGEPAPGSAPYRGGDPAAMLAAARPQRVGLTEMLRNTPPPEASAGPMTKIRLAPKPAAAAPARPAAAPPDALAPLAAGLGLPSDALAGRDATQAATQVASVARAAVATLLALKGLEHTTEATLRALVAPGADAAALLQTLGAVESPRPS